MNTTQKISTILLLILLCVLGLVHVSVRASSPSAERKMQNTNGNSCQQLLINGDLESSGGWQLGSTPAPAAVVGDSVHGGAAALRMGLFAPLNVVAHSSAYQSVTLPSAATQLQLTFWEQAGGGSDGADYREVLILRTNFTTLRSLVRQTAAGSGQWTQQTFDLTDLAGQTVYLYFNVYNNGSGSRMNRYVDDIVLANCSEGSEDTPTPDATLTTTATTTATSAATTTATSAATPVPSQTPVASPTSTPLPTNTPTGELTATPQPTPPLAEGVHLRVGSVEATGLSEVTVPLDLAEVSAGQNVGALSLDLLYDAARLTAAACSNSGALDLLACNIDEPGRIQLSGLAAMGVTDAATLATVRFSVIGTQQDAITLSLRIDSTIDANGVDLATSTQNGQITFNCNPNEELCGSEDKSFIFLPLMRR